VTVHRLRQTVRAGLAALLATAIISPVAAQPAQGADGQPSGNPPSPSYAQPDNTAAPAPPEGQYAPPPPGSENGNAAYDSQAQQADRAYADAYSRWAAQYCVDQHNNNTAAGAVIGGVLGAAIGAAVTHNPATGAAIGGAIGLGTGAVAGASQPTYGCPPGYVVAPGAPAFVYAGPYWGPAVTWAPAWYRPWVWYGGHWVYYPYRYWYWWHRGYWHPGWHARAWHYGFRRW